MLYINEVSKDKSGKISEVKVIYSLDRPDIEFQFSKQVIINCINNGVRHNTAVFMGGKYRNGAEVEVVDGNLRTVANETEEDNLGNLLTF